MLVICSGVLIDTLNFGKFVLVKTFYTNIIEFTIGRCTTKSYSFAKWERPERLGFLYPEIITKLN